MFDGLKDMGKLMKQAKEMKSKMKEVQEQLKEVEVEETGFDGKIKVIITGELELKKIAIDESLITKENQVKLQKAIVKTTNEAIKTAKNLATKKLSAISGGIPGLT
ncbi:YbaB/EbfC family nucleoid-associated protein [bacterium]|jgi:nucleoid-associated protein EbfC|nr:YbaB/EbfC family nucleoid-associated protein [bacterium]